MNEKTLKLIKRKTIVLLLLLIAFAQTGDNAAFCQNDPNQAKQELVQGLNEYTIGSLYKPLILKNIISFEMSPAWWTRMNDKDQKGLHALSFATPDLNEFAKRMGWGDAAAFENAGNGTKEEWKPKIEQVLSQWRPKFSFAFKPDSAKCDSANFDLSLRYLTSLASFLATSDWKPASGVAYITLVPSATAKDISVSISKDGKSFTVIAPDEIEPSEWDTKMQRGLKRGGAGQL